MKIQSVAVLGAGAVGSYVLWGLSQRNDITLGVVAEGERAHRLQTSGCTINHVTYHPHVWTPQQALGVDLLIVALKYGALPGALDSIQAVVGANTTVMSLMNGVDSEDIIAEVIDPVHILPSLIKVASRKEDDGCHFDPDTTIGIIFGERTTPYDSERVQAITELFTDTGMHFRSSKHIMEEIWGKFRLNVCNNLPQAILGAGVGCYRDSEHMQAIRDGLRRELEAIAAAKPDLIIGLQSGMTKDQYTTLSKIAPTIAWQKVSWGDPWRSVLARKRRTAVGTLLYLAGSGRGTAYRN